MRKPAALLAVLGLGLAGAVSPAPAGADIASVSPSSVTVDPGGSAAATVTVRASGRTCVDGRPSDNRVPTPTFSTPCDDESEWRTTMFVQAPSDPGTYTIAITDDLSGDDTGRTFTLIVRSPAPPPPPPTEPTTTVAPTTTTRPTTTTAPTTSTTLPTTTAPPTTSTTVVETTTTAPPLGDPFTPLAELIELPVPTEGVFLPLVGAGFRDCLPLTAACGEPGSGLVLVPARATEITWQPLPEGRVAAPRTELRGVAPLGAVGIGPPEPRASNYALPILDLTAPGGQLRTLLRGMDERGGLSVVTAEQPALQPTVGDGSPIPAGSPASISAMPFGRPTVRTASSFTEAAPALPMFASVEPQVLYALRPDNGWGLNLDLVPLLGGSVPFLVRAVEGPPGLFIARPPNLRVPQADDADNGPRSDEEDGDGGMSPLALLGGAVGLGMVATAGTALVRRRRTASTPRGTSR